MKAKKITTLFLAGMFTFLGIIAVAQPGWDVTPNQYVYSMTITGQVTTDGYLSTDESDKVAAFIDGECRGVTNVKYVSAINEYYVFLMVYSNDPIGTVNFKIWDDSAGEEFAIKQTLSFVVNDIVGSISSPFLFSSSALNSESGLLSFSIPNQEGPTSISGTDVYLEENWSGDLTGIVASFTLSNGAKAFVGGVEQSSGATSNDFLLPVEYTIESADFSDTTVYTVNISTANDIPTDIDLSTNQKPENDSSMFIGFFEAVTENPDEEHLFSLVDQADTEHGYFYISDSGLWANGIFNYEEQTSYKIYVRADDEKGGVVEKYFDIEILDMNDAPTGITMGNHNTPVYTPVNSVVGELSALDEDAGDAHTFSLVAGDGVNDIDNGKFYFDGNQLKNNAPLTFLGGQGYSIHVIAEDSFGATVSSPFDINSQYQVDPPYDITLSNTSVIGIDDPPDFVGTLLAEDPDQQGGHVFSLAENAEFGPDNAFFTISNDTLNFDSPPPISQKSTYEILLAATDAMGNQFGKAFIVTVVEEFRESAFFLANDVVAENQPVNTVVGFFDSDIFQAGEYAFTLPLDIDLGIYDNAKFGLSGRTLLTSAVFDFESDSSFLLLVEISDGPSQITKEVTITVSDQNDPPTGISLSTHILNESTAVDSVVATLAVEDQDTGDAHVFSLIVGNGINDEG
ncbi:MAG: cadherin repeat domain-containing protein, partial [Prolixibacteraceae bacterium]|nr:cadherin repeat domain-containing protein [Prolixibacteraceae bacterium]